MSVRRRLRLSISTAGFILATLVFILTTVSFRWGYQNRDDSTIWSRQKANIPLEKRLFQDFSKVASSYDNKGREAQIRLGLNNLVKLIDGLNFQRAPGKMTIIVDKESAYAFLLDNKTEKVVNASPVCVGALHNNVRNYLSTGAGVHTFYQYYPCGGSSPYGRGALRFHPSTYVTGSECFIAMHGTNQEEWLLKSISPRERYLTHGCIRLLDPFLVPLIDMYEKGELTTLIILPFNNPTNKLIPNGYTRMYFSKWKNSSGTLGGTTINEIITQLRREWI